MNRRNLTRTNQLLLSGADNGVPGAGIDCALEVDRTPEIFSLSQGCGNVRNLDEAEVHGYVPKSFSELR